jgi:metal-responsive CopG/Arc/MetJ family transcriptional regulator
MPAGYGGSVKTAISLPDELFREADRTARRLKLSRSELFRQALLAFMASNRDREITSSYDAAFATTEAPEEQTLRRAAARRIPGEVEWTE